MKSYKTVKVWNKYNTNHYYMDNALGRYNLLAQNRYAALDEVLDLFAKECWKPIIMTEENGDYTIIFEFDDLAYIPTQIS